MDIITYNMSMQKQKILIVIGPTASGKSDLAVNTALELFKNQNKESVIISADSRQVYKYLNVGSGKITEIEMQSVPHFGLSIVEPEEKFTVADWVKYAEDKIKEAAEQNKLPIICGGTGLYVDSLLYGLQDNPAPDYEQRKLLENKTLSELQEMLKIKNQEYFESLNNSERNNSARLIRKLELENYIINNTEENKINTRPPLYDAEFIILKPDLKILENKIKLRLQNRLGVIEASPLIKEVDGLINFIKDEEGLKEIKEERKQKRIVWLLSLGLEYTYVTEYILGQINLEEMKASIILRSLQYAKRQITWNKRYEEMENVKVLR